MTIEFVISPTDMSRQLVGRAPLAVAFAFDRKGPERIYSSLQVIDLVEMQGQQIDSPLLPIHELINMKLSEGPLHVVLQVMKLTYSDRFRRGLRTRA
jgi:hypothetical protein